MLCFHQNIEGGDRSGDEKEHDLCQAYSHSYSYETSQTSDPRCLTNEEAEDLRSGESKTSENPDLPPPLNDRDGDGIVDQKHSDNDGDETEGCQVEVKSRNHLLDLTTPGIGSTGFNPWRG